MGNEGNGISPLVEKRITQKLYIPNYPPEAETTESLNVATATAIVCSEFRRRQSGISY
jgi:TrmH family RNA methyltransferase